MEKIIYLDNAASSPMRPESVGAMLACAETHYANPSAIHALGQSARKALEKSRGEVAALIGADASEVAFTSGATEANNLAIRGVIEPMLDAGKQVHAVTTALEHASVLRTFEDLEKRGLELTVIQPGSDGVVRVEDIVGAVNTETMLVSVIAASNEIGTLQPVAEIGRALKKTPVTPLFHVDGVQAMVSTNVDMHSIRADLFTFSAHKIGGPKGIGAIAVRKGVELYPVLTGGGQESGLRSGTENSAGIAGFAAAATTLRTSRALEIARYESLRARLLTALPPGIKPLVAPGVPVAPHIVALECVGKEQDWMVMLLSRAGVMVSAGSACKAGNREASETAIAMGLNEKRSRSVIRVSFGHASNEKDVDTFIDALTSALSR